MVAPAGEDGEGVIHGMAVENDANKAGGFGVVAVESSQGAVYASVMVAHFLGHQLHDLLVGGHFRH